ncbi:NlpC/P60 family protein [Floccifex porci]|uniref:NlpC/P60 family protein n=1 Tax=Floccifex porci TaxID=2606629 RepID=UPI0012B3A042|nr:NlpC/P60 family protein [Floccifex porci]
MIVSLIENNGKKVASVLCVASCFPVVATVYAMETNPGWHGDKYVNEDATVAKGWQEIEGKSYYFSEEDGTVDEKTTEDAVVATVNVEMTETVTAEVKTETADFVSTEIQKEESNTTDVPEVSDKEEVVEVPETPAEEVPEVPAEEQTPVTPEAPAEQTPAVPETPAEPEAPAEIETPVIPEAPAEQTPAVPETPANPYQDLNDRIASSALSLVGVTDGQWCTQVVQQALALAGVQDAYQLWPDQYVGQYGYYTDDPQAGNLVYYYNGGRGVDHIAVYIGNGMAVHGNYYDENGVSKTVVASVYINGGAPQFIQVQR